MKKIDRDCIHFVYVNSGIHGYQVSVYKPSDPTRSSKMVDVKDEMRHIIFTAETHNFPTGITMIK